ncbi:unnamed protein product [Caenorhabditis sp. 36 PRJEB53466]|nr:unnamed protein product [Caenorhabditis sp. 36 PRJEB53466]
MFFALFLPLFIAFLSVVEAKTFENRIVGKPFVSCRPDAISLFAQTDEFFEGQIYVRGSRVNPACVKHYTLDENSTALELKIDADQLLLCGFKASPKPNSKKWLLTGHIIVAFHRNLVTPSDRAFRAHCEFDDFRRDAEIGVQNLLEKHDILTGNFETAAAAAVTMTILSAGEESLAKNAAESARVLKVGDPIIFQWKMERERDGIFGIQLERCSAETASGKGTKIIENGCSLDEQLISDATFSPDNSNIFANSLAFKFPDEHVVYIRCAVRTCVKRTEHLEIINGSEEDLCVSQPECGLNQRNRRQLSNGNNTRTDIIHVNGRFQIERHRNFEHLRSPERSLVDTQFCFPDTIYSIGVSAMILCYLATISTTVWFKCSKC